MAYSGKVAELLPESYFSDSSAALYNEINSRTKTRSILWQINLPIEIYFFKVFSLLPLIQVKIYLILFFQYFFILIDSIIRVNILLIFIASPSTTGIILRVRSELESFHSL